MTPDPEASTSTTTTPVAPPTAGASEHADDASEGFSADDATEPLATPETTPPSSEGWRTTSTVRAADRWPTNAELIEDVAAFGWLRSTDHVLDPTFGKGVWWRRWRPDRLTTHYRAEDGTDFRHLDYPDATFAAVAYDPPYVCPGGIKTSTVQDFHDSFGMAEGRDTERMFSNPAELQAVIDAGTSEMWRLVRPAETLDRGGIVLVKCQNYVWGGDLWPGAELTLRHAESCCPQCEGSASFRPDPYDPGLVVGCPHCGGVGGFRLVARMEHLGNPGPQPKTNPDGSPRRQANPRYAHSTLLVLRRPKPKPVPPPALF
jgi:hypothetical protein